MPVVAIVPDRFQAGFSKQLSATQRGQGAGKGADYSDVRRPTRGIQLKDDSYAILKLIRGDGTEIPLVNAGSRMGSLDGDKMTSNSYSNFLIQAVNEERMEKQQVVETFGEAFIFFYGQRPRVLSIQGALLNTDDFNWEAEWWFNYDNYLRGTKCVENDARVYLTYDDTMVSGYILNTSSTKSAAERNFVPFSFQIFVTDYTSLSQVGNPNITPASTPVSTLTDAAQYYPQLALGPAPASSSNNPFANTTFEGITETLPLNQLPTSLSPAAIPQLTSMSLAEGLASVGLSSISTVRNAASPFVQMGTQIATWPASQVAAGVAAVKSIWSSASQLAKTIALPGSTTNNYLGAVVRVPIGFAGAMAFDSTYLTVNDIDQAGYGLAGINTVVAFSTYAENWDEFVDSSGTYEGSRLVFEDQGFPGSMAFGAASVAGTDSGVTAVQAGEFDWSAQGLAPPNSDVADLTAGIRDDGSDSWQVVGNNEKWLATKGQPIVSTSAVKPLTVGTQDIVGSAVSDTTVLPPLSPMGVAQALAANNKLAIVGGG